MARRGPGLGGIGLIASVLALAIALYLAARSADRTVSITGTPATAEREERDLAGEVLADVDAMKRATDRHREDVENALDAAD